MPRVSVILNCYNHALYVAEAVESVLAQTFADFELILIDNGSTDDTRLILDRYDDPRIRRFYHDRNQSLSTRLNEGVAQAAGEFVAILYSDDLMLPDKLERQVAIFEALPAEYGVVYCPAIGFNQFTGECWTKPSYGLSGDILIGMFDRHFDGAVDMSSPLTRAACFRENHWHDDLFIDGEAIFFRIARDWKFHFDSQPTVKLRDHSSNLSKGLRRNVDMHLEIMQRLAEDRALEPAAKTALRRHRARYAVYSSWAYVRLGGKDRGWVRAKLGEAARSNLATALCNWRFLGALGLSFLPSSLSRSANRLGDRLRSSPGNRALLEE